MHALLHGRVAEAFAYNGFLVALLPVAALAALWELYGALRWGRFRAVPALLPALWGVGAAAAVFGVWRNVA